MSPEARTLARQAVVEVHGRPWRLPLRRRWLAVGLAAVVLLTGWVAWADRHDGRADVRDGTTAVTVEGMAAEHGVNVSLVGVTAAGGLVELRFQVVDPDKAAEVLHDGTLRPILVEEDTGATLVMSSPPHHHGAELKLGGTYYFLLANARSALRAGSEVTLVIGDSRLEHIDVQG